MRFFLNVWIAIGLTISVYQIGRAQSAVNPIPPTVLVATITDSSSGKALSFANAALATVGDSIVSSSLVPENGKLVLKAPKDGVYVLVISYVGYGTYKRRVRIAGSTDIGTVSLGKKAQELAEVEIFRSSGKLSFVMC